MLLQSLPVAGQPYDYPTSYHVMMDYPEVTTMATYNATTGEYTGCSRNTPRKYHFMITYGNAYWVYCSSDVEDFRPIMGQIYDSSVIYPGWNLCAFPPTCYHSVWPVWVSSTLDGDLDSVIAMYYPQIGTPIPTHSVAEPGDIDGWRVSNSLYESYIIGRTPIRFDLPGPICCEHNPYEYDAYPIHGFWFYYNHPNPTEWVFPDGRNGQYDFYEQWRKPWPWYD